MCPSLASSAASSTSVPATPAATTPAAATAPAATTAAATTTPAAATTPLLSRDVRAWALDHALSCAWALPDRAASAAMLRDALGSMQQVASGSGSGGGGGSGSGSGSGGGGWSRSSTDDVYASVGQLAAWGTLQGSEPGDVGRHKVCVGWLQCALVVVCACVFVCICTCSTPPYHTTCLPSTPPTSPTLASPQPPTHRHSHQHRHPPSIPHSYKACTP